MGPQAFYQRRLRSASGVWPRESGAAARLLFSLACAGRPALLSQGRPQSKPPPPDHTKQRRARRPISVKKKDARLRERAVTSRKECFPGLKFAQQANLALVCTENGLVGFAPSLRRHEVLCPDAPSKLVVAVLAHPREGHIACGEAASTIRPEGE